MNDRLREPSKIRTLVAQAVDRLEGGSTEITPPIHVATTFSRNADNGYDAGPVYGRMDNASIHHVEAKLALIEGGQQAMLFNSGMSAATSVFLALRPTHVVVPTVLYWGLRLWLQEVERFGHRVTAVDMSDIDAVRAAIEPGVTGLVWIETPSNPLWTLTDIAAVADCAHRAGALVCADSTVCTPVLTRPIEFGADLVLHSATKYLNGHSDVVAGVLVAAQCSELWTRIHRVREQHGCVLGPFDAFLLTRGMRTLDLRVREQSRSALSVASRLVGHPALDAVLYPGLPTHPGHAIARRQMQHGFGGMVSLRVKGGQSVAIEIAKRVELWTRATSFGGIESLIEHRASMEGAGSPCPGDLLRLSVGLEDPDDLYVDLVRALDSVV